MVARQSSPRQHDSESDSSVCTCLGRGSIKYESETVTRSVDVCLDVCLSKTYKNSAQKKTHQNISNGYPIWQG